MAESFVRNGQWVELIFTDKDGREHDHRIGSLCDPCMDDRNNTSLVAHAFANPETPDGMETYQVACYLPNNHAHSRQATENPNND